MKPRAKQFKPRLKEADAKETDNLVRSLETIMDLRMPLSQVSGLYFLFDGEELVYIGQSLDVTRRLCQHREKRIFAFDTFSVIPLPPQHLDYYERIAISAHRPRLNQAFPIRIPPLEARKSNGTASLV